MDEGFDADAGQEVGRHQRRQHRAQHGQLVVLDPAVPHVLLEHADAVEHHDPAERRLEAGVEERRQPRPDCGPRLRLGQRGGHDAGDGVGLDGVVDGPEQVVLAAEVVVQRPFGDPGALDDLLDRRRREALAR